MGTSVTPTYLPLLIALCHSWLFSTAAAQAPASRRTAAQVAWWSDQLAATCGNRWLCARTRACR